MIASLLFPRKCPLCRRILRREEQNLCKKCREETEEYPYSFLKFAPERKKNLQFLDSFTAVWYYEGKVRDSLRRFKFYGARSYARDYGAVLAAKLLRGGACVDAVTWVPVSAKRRRHRGYDQAELLARAVARELNLPVVALLRKNRDNPPQSSESGEARRANVLGVYDSIGDAAGKRLLLIDDILTTGATANECARVLKTAGAAQVHCAVAATTRMKQKQTSR